MAITEKPEYSVIIPVFNSSSTITKLIEGISETFDELGYSFDIVLVDDGSTDNVWEIILELKQRFKPFLTAIRLKTELWSA